MAQTIKLKRSSNSGASGIPSTSQLALGEVGINTYHGKLYIKKNDGNDAIVEVSADKLPLTGGTLTGDLNFSTGSIGAPTSGIFRIDGASGKEVEIFSARDIRLVIDDNNDDTDNTFQVFKHDTASANKLFEINQDGDVVVTGTLDLTQTTSYIYNTATSGQIELRSKNSGDTYRGVRWDTANNTNGAWRPETTGGPDLGLTNKLWNNLYVNTIKVGSSNLEVIDSSRNITAGTINTSGNITVSIPDGGSQPAMTALFKMYGYEGRGVGIKIRDSANSASSPSNREWFIGSGYNQSGFNIGYSSTGSQSSYAAQNKFSINTSGNAIFAGTISSGAITASDAVIVDGGTGVSSTGVFHVRQSGDDAGSGIAITSSNATSHRIWKNSSGVLNIGSSSNTDAFQQDLTGNVTIQGTISSGAVTSTGTSSFGKFQTTGSGTLTAPRYDTSMYVVQSQHWYGHSSTQTMFIGESGNNIRLRGEMNIGSDVNADAGKVLSVRGDMNVDGALVGTTATFIANAAAGTNALNILGATNGSGTGITFSDNGTPAASASGQNGYLTYYHSDGASYGSGNAFILSSSETTTTILADGKLMYKEGIYSKPATGTGAGTRKDANWDTAYTYSQVGHLPLAGDTMTGALTIDVDNQAGGALRIEANQTNPDQDIYFAEEIYSTLSGSTVTTGDREQGGLYLDINSTATGGDTSNEHRVYGVYADVDSTGDADVVVGIYGNATATPTTGTTTSITGGHFHAEDNGGAGSTTSVYGIQSLAVSDNATSDINGMYAGYFKAYNVADSGAIVASTAVYGELEIPSGTADIYGNSYVFRAEYDNNGTVAQTNSTYLYYGNYAGVLPTTAYGVYIQDDIPNVFIGSVRSGLGTTSVAGYGFNGDVNTGMYSPANHQLGLLVNGSRKLFIDSTGVDIQNGTLEVGGTTVIDASRNITGVNITTTGYIRGPATFVIDPATHGNDTGTLVIAGNLQVDGTTTTINSTAVTIDDKTLTLASGSANAAAANGAGIIIDDGSSGTEPSLTYNGTDNNFDINRDLDVYTSASTGSFNIGRDSTQRFNLHVTDYAGYIRYYQDETSTQDHSVNFEIVSSSTGANKFYFNRPISVSAASSSKFYALSLTRSGSNPDIYDYNGNHIIIGPDSSTPVLKVKSGQILVPDGTQAAPAYSFLDRPDTGIFAGDYGSPASDGVNIVTDGVTRGSFNSAGITSASNVYTGTTSSFRNYAGDWTATTGTADKHFYFKNNTYNVLLDITSDGEATFSNKSLGIGFITLQNVKNEAANQYVRGSIIFSRDDGQISWDSTNDQWTHAGGGSTDWSMIAHDSNYLSIYSGPQVASATNYTHTAFKDNFLRLAIEHSTGNIGIGTRAPDQLLHLKKSSGTTMVKTEVGANSTVGFNIKKTGSTTQEWKIVDGQTVNGVLEIYDATDSRVVMGFKGDGTVGIGTSSPDTKLDVENNANSTTTIRVNNATGGTAARANLRMQSNSAQFDLYATSSSYTGVTGWADAGILSTASTASAGLILNAEAGGIKFQYGTTTKALIDTSGRLLINATTTAFSDKLYVNGDAYVTGGWRIGTGATYTGKIYNSSGIMSIETDSNRDIQFGDSGTPAIMYIDTSTEKVGIGTSPAKTLHVSSSNDAPIRVESTDATTGIEFKDNNGSSQLYYIGSSNKFYTSSPLALGGSTLSGSNTKLQVNGDVRVENSQVLAGRESEATPSHSFHDDSDTGMFNINPNILAFSTAGTERMRVAADGSWMVSNTTPRPVSQHNNQAGMGWYDVDLHAEIATTGNRSALEVGKNNSNDGAIITLRHQATTVGEVGSNTSSYLYIGRGDTTLSFSSSSDLIYPTGTGGATRSGVIDLGNSANLFRDAHFSGTVDTGSVKFLGGDNTGTSEASEGAHFEYAYAGAGTNITTWYKVCDVVIGTGLYKALSMNITLHSQYGNFGSSAGTQTHEYSASFYRSAGTQDSPNNASLVGFDPDAHELRIIKTSTGNYELQLKNKVAYRDAFIHIFVGSANLGTVTIAGSRVTGSTSGTTYTATAPGTSVNHPQLAVGKFKASTIDATNKIQLTGSLANWSVDYQGVIMDFTRPSASYIKASNASGYLVFQTGGSYNRMSINASGNVAIGSHSPTAKLHISGNSDTSDEDCQLIIQDVDGSSGSQIPSIQFKNSSANTARIRGTGHVGLVISGSSAQGSDLVVQAGKVGIGTTGPKAALQIEEYGIDTTTTATSATTQVTVDTFPIADFRTARYTIQITNTTDSTYHTTEILLIHDGTDAHITEYATIFTGAAAEATFTADIDTPSSNVRLRATPESTNSRSFKVVRHSITV